MLINKSSKIDVGDIMSFKLVNGDEVIGKVVSESAEDFVLNKACLAIPSERGVGLMQAMFTFNPDADVPVSKSAIMMKSHTMDQLKQHYLKTTTGIELLPQGSKLR